MNRICGSSGMEEECPNHLHSLPNECNLSSKQNKLKSDFWNLQRTRPVSLTRSTSIVFSKVMRQRHWAHYKRGIPLRIKKNQLRAHRGAEIQSTLGFFLVHHHFLSFHSCISPFCKASHDNKRLNHPLLGAWCTKHSDVIIFTIYSMLLFFYYCLVIV